NAASLWRRQDIAGKTVREAFGEELYARDADFLRRGLHGEAVRFETRMSGPDGPRTVEVTAIPDCRSPRTRRGSRPGTR
ncbi:hypothetical protein, partial [Achromobacter sp. GbtcB20]|uniref:hypothetical protein n=1 Tax=Achromobacter sp. GbtcB20 TaxID=2824765 RepID=UPI001C305055